MKAANQDMTRAINQFRILDAIRQAGSISRVEIASATGQSRASVTNITASMMEQGLILESQGQAPPTRGRRRIMLSLNPEAAYVVGVKISAFQISFAVLDFVAGVRSALIVPVSVARRSQSYIATVIEDGVRHCVRDSRLGMEDISGIGIGIPGFVDSATGVCHWNPLYKEEKAGLKELVCESMGIPVFIENDANAVTVGEQWFGLGQGVRNFLVVTIEHGLGTGIVVDGKLYRGSTGIGAEFGHMVLVPDGEPCRCGKKGCIEAYTSDESILRRAKEILSQKKRGKADPERLSIEDVTEMAKGGDKAMLKLFRESGRVLGQGIAGLIQIFNPERVIVTGEGVRAGDMLFNPMRRSVKKFLNKEMARATEIVVQKWADDDWARGAAGFVLSELYRSPKELIKKPQHQL